MNLKKAFEYWIKNKKYILTLIIAFVVVFITALGISNAVLSAIALEQEAMCGVEQHIHEDSCYSADLLVCEKDAHVHDENCYIVLLNENDINDLLIEIDDSDDKSLDSVLDNVVTTVIETKNEAEQQTEISEEEIISEEFEEPIVEIAEETAEEVTEETVEETAEETVEETVEEIVENSEVNEKTEFTDSEGNLIVNKDNIAEINDGIEADDTLPDIVLNEEINTAETITPIEETAVVEISPLALDETPSVSNLDANIYAYVDGSWSCIGAVDFTAEQSGWWSRNYSVELSTADVTAAIEATFGISLSYNDFGIYWTSSLEDGDWLEADSVGQSTITLDSIRNQTTARSTKYLRIVNDNPSNQNDALEIYSVTYNNADGTSDMEYVVSGNSITLPDGTIWLDQNGNAYEGGETVTITHRTIFSVGDADYIRINYDIDFPSISGVTVSDPPTIEGSSTYSETIDKDQSATIKNVNKTTVEGVMASTVNGQTRIIRFSGWRVGDTDTILSADAVLDWDALSSYASGIRVNLTAVWEYDPRQTCSFFILFNTDNHGSTSTDHFTNQVFVSYVGGALEGTYVENQQYEILPEDDTLTSAEKDKKIRNLHGMRGEGIWLESFPTDEYIFNELKQYASELVVEDERVSVDDLHENAYAIRWYKLASQSDAWHLDGELVKKQGRLKVQKTFAGNDNAIAIAKENFYIDATGSRMGTKTLTLDDYTDYDAETDTYTWLLDDITYGEEITVTEHNMSAESYDSFSEYVVSDAYGGQSTNGIGTSVSVTGDTYALDVETDIMSVEFINIYKLTDSLIIKKEDNETKKALRGATFELYQNGQLLSFEYNADEDRYELSENGDVTELSGTDGSGFIEIAIAGLSYDDGDITVHEKQVPSGYVAVSDIVLSQNDDGVYIKTGVNARYANGVLAVGNSSESTSVTVRKIWDCPQSEWEPVTIALLANGRMASAYFANISATVELSSANSHEYTWRNLPASVDGNPITWSVRETKIGNESCKEDYTFANWNVVYGIPIYTYDSSGKITNTLLTITNDTKRVRLRLTKTDFGMENYLSGAVFKLELINTATGEIDESFAARLLTTGTDGVASFDNIPYGRYMLTELSAPDGYIELDEIIYLTINQDNTITVDESIYAEVDERSSFSIIVKNYEAVPLPETGGSTTMGHYIAGLFLMLASVYIYITYLRKREVCRNK